MNMKSSRHISVFFVSLFGLVLLARFTVAATSFLGQGTVPFDGIKAGRNDADKIELNGTVLNSRKNKPVLVSDNLKVKDDVIVGKNIYSNNGSLDILDDAELYGSMTINNGDLVFSGSTNGWIRAAGTSIVGINDDLIVQGTTYLSNTSISGSLTMGAYNVGTTLVNNAALTNRLSNFIDCVGQFAEITTYLESEDYIFCFNLWLAGEPGTVSISSTGQFSELQQSQINRAAGLLSGDQINALTPSFKALKKL